MASSKPLFVYWDIRALGEPIRLLLHYLEVDFEDRRIPAGEYGPGVADPWFKQKFSHGLDFPNLPFYVDDGVKITQSIAIMQHIGRKYNLAGDTLEEKATIDMLTQTVNDLRWAAWIQFNSEKFHEIKEDWKKTIPSKLSQLSKFLDGKDFVLGNKLSYVDFHVYESMEWYRQFAPEIFEKSPELENLNKFQKRIEVLPQIRKYMESEKFKAWPFFLPIVNFGCSKDPDFKPIPFSHRDFFARYPIDPTVLTSFFKDTP